MTQDSYLKKTVKEWITTLEDKDPLVRRLAAHALSEIGPGAKSAIPTLKNHLKDPEPFLRVWAAFALAHVCPGTAEAMDTLLGAMDEQEAFVRGLAAWQLGRLGPRYPGINAAIPAISKGLDDKDPSVTTETAATLKRLRGTRRDFPQPPSS